MINLQVCFLLKHCILNSIACTFTQICIVYPLLKYPGLERQFMIKYLRKEKESIDVYGDKIISIAIMIPFIILTLQHLILNYFELSDSSTGTIIQIVSKILVGLFFLLGFRIVFNRNPKNIIITYSITIFLLLINYLFFPENHFILNDLIFSLLFMCIPALLYSQSILEMNILKKIMRKASIIVLIIGILLGVLVFTGNVSIGLYSMSFSYYMLLPSIIFIDEYIQKPNIKAFLYALIPFILILTFGARGPLIGIIVFILLRIIRPSYKLTYKSILFNVSSFVIMIFILFNLGSFFQNINNVFFKFGVESRNLSILSDNRILTLSNRDTLFENVGNEIIKNPLMGIGLGGDRRIIDGYTHNFIIELLGNYGVVFGSILIMIFIIMITGALFTPDKENYNIFIIWLSVGFVHLMVSSSYLIDFRFWLFLGILINVFKNKNSIKVSKQEY